MEDGRACKRVRILTLNKKKDFMEKKLSVISECGVIENLK